MTLEDVQGRQDHRRLPIDQVGISGLHYPIAVWDRLRGQQHTVGEFALAVDLPAEVKGAHLSRFVETVDRHVVSGPVGPASIMELATDARQRQNARFARVEVRFPYFVQQKSPATGSAAFVDYRCTLVAESRLNAADWHLSARVPVTSVCPCSKAISDYGAHNQRGFVTLTVHPAPSGVDPQDFMWIDDLITVGEGAGSAPVRALVKRPDERELTMTAFDNPVFVEDMVRTAADALRKDERVASFAVEASNDESIHNHAAYALIASGGVPSPRSG